MSFNKPLLFLGIASLLIIAGSGCSSAYNPNSSGQNNPTGVVSVGTTSSIGTPTLATSSPATSANPSRTVRPPVTRLPSTGLTYSQAFDIYQKLGAFFQFVDCHANPSTFSIKQGLPFMLDNRDNKYHTVVIGRSSYRLKPYGFAIVFANPAGNLHITCDGAGTGELYVNR